MTTAMAPIAFFAYMRPHHTRLALEALSQCEGVMNSHLFIFCDGPKGIDDLEVVREVRSVVRARQWAGEVTIIEHDHNQGLAASIIAGVTKVLNEFGVVIVLEDDLVVSPFFIRYMNQALRIYSHVNTVMHIAGYMFPVNGVLPETFFYRVPSCWGWATWQRAWTLFEPRAFKLIQTIKEMKREHEFDIDGAMKYVDMLEMQAEGKVDSWAIRWYASTFIYGGLSLHPGLSLVHNIGHDGSGVHCDATNRYATSVSQDPVKEFSMEIAENKHAVKLIRRYYVDCHDAPGGADTACHA